MKALGIILSSIHNEVIDELTHRRTTASIPFGGKYRIIDFVLSNFVNADITNVGVLTQKNYQSLMDHIGNGRDWDLARKNGGLIVFPPFSSTHSDFLYETRLEALRSINGFISKQTSDVVVITDCDSVNVVDYNEVLEYHKEKNADITIIYQNRIATKDLYNHMNYEIDDNGKIISGKVISKENEKLNISLNIFVINRKLLVELLNNSVEQMYSSFHRDLIFNNINKLNVYGYEYTGTYLHLNSMENYFKCNMKILDKDVRYSLFGKNEYRIYTKVKDSAPSRYLKDAKVSNSVIGDGCEIEGTVINSILFRGVKVSKGAIVKNSIIMQDTVIDSNSKIEYIIADKNVYISKDLNLNGCEKEPYYISKGKSL